MQDNTKQQYLKHLDSIIGTYEGALISDQYGNICIPDDIAHGLIARTRNTVAKMCGGASPYVEEIESILGMEWAISYKVEIIVGILKSLRSDLEDGFLDSLTELVRAEIFDDFIDMAEYLVNDGYKDAAAVIAGSALEAHLRRLRLKYGVRVEIATTDGTVRNKRAEQMNQDLGKIGYSLLDQKQITAWLELRNSAAHGKYDAYSQGQVPNAAEWVRDFIMKNPA
jgi:hypothetical protein